MTKWIRHFAVVFGALTLWAALSAMPAEARGSGVCDFLRGSARQLCIQAEKSQNTQTQTRPQRQTQQQTQTRAPSQPTRDDSSYDQARPEPISNGGFPRPNPARPPRVVQTCDNGSSLQKNGQLTDACHNLVMFHLKEAADGFTTFCDQGDRIACHELAAMYFQQRVAPPSGKTSAQAGAYYDDKACAMGNPAACENLGFAYRDMPALSARRAEALGMFEKACDFHGSRSCYAVGDYYKFGGQVAVDNDTALAYYQAACQYNYYAACVWKPTNIAMDCPAKRIERSDSLGHLGIICMMPQGIPEYQVRVGGAEAASIAARENAPPEDALSKDNTGLTLAEQSAVYHKPQAYADLCMKHNARACYAISAYTENYHMAEIVGSEDDKAWTKANSQAVLTALQQQCRTVRTGPLDTDYCEAARTMDYAVASAFGGGDPGAHCLEVNGTGNTVNVYNVDQSGSKSYDHSETQATGADLKNTCRFAIDIRLYGMDDAPATLAAGQTKHTGPGFLGGLLNYNSLSIRWVKKH